MSKNIGTLITAAIRPNNSLDRIATAYSSEIKGGLHTATASSDRDSIIIERRDWGMMCYVVNDDITYQLKYGWSSTDITDNSNWVVFSNGANEWIDSVISITYSPPGSPTIGNRYLGGTKVTDTLGGSWTTYSPGIVFEYNNSGWSTFTPSDGVSVRVDNEDNAIYRYEGTYPSGEWNKESLSQIRYLDVTSSDGIYFTASSAPIFDNYSREMIFLTTFGATNSGTTFSININSLGEKQVKKITNTGLSDFYSDELVTNVVYSLVYDGTYFQLIKHIDDTELNNKYLIEPNDYIVVPPYHQYWIYSDLEIQGTLVNYGQVYVVNGSLIMSGGTFSNFGDIFFLSLSPTLSFEDSSTIGFTVSGSTVSAYIIDDSIVESKLKVTNTPSNGQVLGYNGSDFVWVTNVSGEQEPVYQIATASSTSGTNASGAATGLTLSYAPTIYSRIEVFINGHKQRLLTYTQSQPFNGWDCWFGTATQSNIPILGDNLIWNSESSGFILDSGDVIEVVYEK